jgi:MFS family permease
VDRVADAAGGNGRKPAGPLTRNVKALSLVSLLTDASSEMILPLLPLFVTTVLGASATMLGAIEGLADSISSLLKLASGWWSDRVRRRKPIVVAGYGIASVVRPLMAFATHPWHVMLVRAADRVGKGIRSSPRDALIADATPAADRGRAYGFHRAADNFGAVVGPVAAWLLLQQGKLELRTVFLWASVPALLSLVVLALFVRDVERPGATNGAKGSTAANAAPTVASTSGASAASLGAGFWRYLAVVFVFTMGCSTDAFLLLRASQIGVAAAWIPILWAGHNLVRAVTSTPGGHLSDHVGRKPLIVAGWAVYAAVYLLFAFATEAWQAWVVLLAYGLYFGLVEGAEKAFVADLVPAERRGAAFGWFNFVVGVGALPASLIFGLVWDRVSPVAAFGLSATLAGAASAGLLLLVPRQQQR